MFTWLEWMILAAAVLALSAGLLPRDFWRGLNRGLRTFLFAHRAVYRDLCADDEDQAVEEALTTDNRTVEAHAHPTAAPRGSWLLFLAQGFGSGRLPGAPGTWGTGIGFVWFGILLLTGDPAVFAMGTAAGLAIAVWACGEAERRLGCHDPGSVVLDEIVAVPLCFLVLLADQSARSGFPDLMEFLRAWPAWVTPAVFVAFRVFDIVKPWPVRQLQALPGGWGVVADDVMAALWVSGVSVVLLPAR